MQVANVIAPQGKAGEAKPDLTGSCVEEGDFGLLLQTAVLSNTPDVEVLQNQTQALPNSCIEFCGGEENSQVLQGLLSADNAPDQTMFPGDTLLAGEQNLSGSEPVPSETGGSSYLPATGIEIAKEVSNSLGSSSNIVEGESGPPVPEGQLVSLEGKVSQPGSATGVMPPGIRSSSSGANELLVAEGNKSSYPAESHSSAFPEVVRESENPPPITGLDEVGLEKALPKAGREVARVQFESGNNSKEVSVGETGEISKIQPESKKDMKENFAKNHSDPEASPKKNFISRMVGRDYGRMVAEASRAGEYVEKINSSAKEMSKAQHESGKVGQETVPGNIVQVGESPKQNPVLQVQAPAYDKPAFDEVRMLDQIVKKLEILLKGGRSETRIRLEPPRLGELRVKVVVEEGMLTVEFRATSHHVKGFLEANLARLKESLEQHGLQVKDFNVQVGNSGRDGDKGNHPPLSQARVPQDLTPDSFSDQDSEPLEMTGEIIVGNGAVDCLA